MFPTESAISSKPEESAPDAAAHQADVAPAPGSGPRPFPGQSIAGRFGNRWWRALGILVCLEVGIFLLVVPWSQHWTGNLLLGFYPALRPLYLSHFLRGAISGLGLLNLWFAFRGVWDFGAAGNEE